MESEVAVMEEGVKGEVEVAQAKEEVVPYLVENEVMEVDEVMAVDA